MVTILCAVVSRCCGLHILAASSSLHDLKPTLALEPVRDDEDAALDLLTRTSAPAAIAHVKKIAELTGAGRVHRLNEYAGFG
jgi:hypothetical protein